MSILELTFVIAITLLVSITSLGLINTQCAILKLQVAATFLSDTAGPAAEAMQKIVGRAKTVSVYDTVANANGGGTPLAPTAQGAVVRLTFADPLYPGDTTINSYALIEYDSTGKRLIFWNSSNGKQWYIATGVTTCTFTMANGLLMANIQSNGKGVDILLEQQ